MEKASCAKCGVALPFELTAQKERPPCPKCGGVGLNVELHFEDSISMAISDESSLELTPQNQGRDWVQRWELIQDEYQSISTPSTEELSPENIRIWHHKLASFFVQAYHLKDSLVIAAPALGLTSSTIETAISNDSRLALLADLANLDKHAILSKKPRSGTIPVLKTVSGIEKSSSRGWLLSVKIEHGADVLDGLKVAKEAVEAWKDKLSAWGIL